MFRLTRVAATKFTPLNKQVLLSRATPATETASGIMIPQAVQQSSNEAKVVAVANETKDWSPSVKVNDMVLLREWGGQTVKLDGEEFVLMGEKDLLGVLSE